MDGKRCASGGCQNTVSGKFRTCLTCRLSKMVDNRVRKEREKKRQEREKRLYFGHRTAKQPWTQARWERFVRAGGLEGL